MQFHPGLPNNYFVQVLVQRYSVPVEVHTRRVYKYKTRLYESRGALIIVDLQYKTTIREGQ